MNPNHIKHISFSTHRRHQDWIINRRVFFKATVVLIACLAMAPLSLTYASTRPNTARFGIATDSHYADKNSSGSRYYRESLDKMTECIEIMNKQEVDFVVEIGDFIDEGANKAQTISNLQAIEGVFNQFNGPIYHVFGNHDMGGITKSQFLGYIENTDIVPSDSKYYSFDVNGLHLVVLDACYLDDGNDCAPGNFTWTDTNIPSTELNWLEQDLAAAQGPAIVFIHQQLDGTGDYYVNNAADVRQVLEESGKVLAVFQGHRHEGDYSYIGNIHYYTFKAMIEGSGEENNSYAIVEVHSDRSITVSAYRQAIRMEFDARCSIADLNGDCEVDLKDFAAMANDWLEIGM